MPETFRPFRLEYEALALSLPFIPVDATRIRDMIDDLEAWQPLDEVDRVDADQSYLIRQRFNPHIGVHEQLRLYCLAALQARLGDVAAARVALGELAVAPADDDVREFIEDLVAMGEARIAFAAGDYATALAHLDRVRQYKYMRGEYSGFFHRGDAHYLRGRCLVELGRYEEAPGWFAGAREKTEFAVIYSAFGHLGTAEAMEALGQPEAAEEHYGSFLYLMDGCDPEYEEEVARARERLQ